MIGVAKVRTFFKLPNIFLKFYLAKVAVKSRFSISFSLKTGCKDKQFLLIFQSVFWSFFSALTTYSEELFFAWNRGAKLSISHSYFKIFLKFFPPYLKNFCLFKAGCKSSAVFAICQTIFCEEISNIIYLKTSLKTGRQI